MGGRPDILGQLCRLDDAHRAGVTQRKPDEPRPIGTDDPGAGRLDALLQRAPAVAGENRRWVRQHALFAPAVQGFVERLRAAPPA